ncbi:unnamed protein product [Closterium sp. NIES-64]|nr:unnamed protein product [Closterium sp. NIES-64]
MVSLSLTSPSGAYPAPPADADATVRSQWATRDAAARLAVRRHRPYLRARSVRRLPLAGDAALARAKGAGALEGRAGAVEVEVEAAGGVGVAVGVKVGEEVSVAAVEAEVAVAVAVGAEVAEVAAVQEAAEAAVVAEAAEATEAAGVAVELVAGLRRGVARVVVYANSSSAVVRPCPLTCSTAALGTGEAAALGACDGAALGAGASASSVLKAAPHSSQFPPIEAPQQTLHMDVWGPARVRGQGHERYFLLLVLTTTRVTPRLTFTPGSPGRRPPQPCVDGEGWRCVGVPGLGISGVCPRLVCGQAVPSCCSLRLPGFPPDAPGWQFYHPTSRRVLSSRDVTFDDSVPYYRLFPYRTPSLPPPPLFLIPGPPRVDPLPPQDPAPSGVSQVDAVEPVEVTGDSGTAEGAGRGGSEPGGAETGVLSLGVLHLGVLSLGVLRLGVLSLGVLRLGVLSLGVLSLEVLRLEVLRVLPLYGSHSLHRSFASGLPSAGAVLLELEVLRLLRVLLSWVPEVLVLAVLELLGLRVRPELVLLRVLALRLLVAVLLGILLVLLEVVELLEVLLERVLLLGVLPVSRPASPVRAARTSGRGSRQRPPPVPGMFRMSLRPSTAPVRALLPSPLVSSLPALADPESDSLRAASPTVTRLLATIVTDPSFESTAASALVTELVDFAARCRLDYGASLVAESEYVYPPSVGGECALGTDVLEDRQEEFLCLAAASPHLVSVLLTPEGDPDALDIPTPRSYAEAIEGTYVDAVPPPGANIVSDMWIFRVKRPSGSPPIFNARYVARGFSLRQGVDYFQTFSPTPKITTLRVLLHVAAHRDYELHSLDFSTAFLQGSLHEEIWLRCPLGFTGTFPPGTQWSLRRPLYGLRQAPREWHDTLRTTLVALGFAPSTADPSLFLRTDTSLPPFYILVYVDDLVFATADTAGLAHVKSELQKRHTCRDLEHMAAAKRVLRYLCSTSGMGLVLGGRSPVVLTGHADASWADDQATQRSSQGYTFSLGSGSVSWRATRSPSVLGSSCEAEIYAEAMAAQELRWLTYLLTDLGEPPRSPPVLYVDNKAMLALCREQRLEHRTKHIALCYFLARELKQRGQLWFAYVASEANTADVFTKALAPCDHQRFCTQLGLVPVLPHLLTS